MGPSSTPESAVLERTNQEFSTCRIWGKICQEGEGRSEAAGGGGVATRLQEQLQQVSQNQEEDGSSEEEQPPEQSQPEAQSARYASCSRHVPRRVRGPRTQGAPCLQDTNEKIHSPHPGPHPGPHPCSSGSRPQAVKECSRGFSDALLHKGCSSFSISGEFAYNDPSQAPRQTY